MKYSDVNLVTTGNKANGNTDIVPFCSLKPPKHGVNLRPGYQMGHTSANPCTPAEVNGGYTGGLKDFGPFGRNYFPQCCHAAHTLDEIWVVFINA